MYMKVFPFIFRPISLVLLAVHTADPRECSATFHFLRNPTKLPVAPFPRQPTTPLLVRICGAQKFGLATPREITAHNNLHAVLFQTSVEYVLVCLQIYQLARHVLKQRLDIQHVFPIGRDL